jgi:hypothetical protein
MSVVNVSRWWECHLPRFTDSFTCCPFFAKTQKQNHPVVERASRLAGHAQSTKNLLKIGLDHQKYIVLYLAERLQYLGART